MDVTLRYAGHTRSWAFRALTILMTTALGAPALSAEFAPAINLATLNGTSGFRLDGAAASDASGRSVASAGDVNGDGFDDLIVGASGADPNGSFSGSSYVVFGKALGFAAAVDLGSLTGANGFRLDGFLPFENSGSSVASAGDVNGDGFGDLIVGSPNGYGNENNTGASYVVFGKATGFAATINPVDLTGANGFRLDGVGVADASGISVASAGDVNGDGFDDLIVGASGADPNGSGSGSSYVVFGKPSRFPFQFDLASLTGVNGFRLDGAAIFDASGRTAASAGDVNGDGFDDLIVGASGADPNGSDSGSSFVVFGKASGFAATVNLASLTGVNGFRLDGVAASDGSGTSVASAGDVNGDGFADLIVGASGADSNGSSSGSSYVVFGKASGFAATVSLGSLTGANGFRIDGATPGERIGSSVASAGDVNGDGFDDVIAGAIGADHNGAGTGSSYVVFGKASGFAATLNLGNLAGVNGFRLDGATVSDVSGVSVASAGDVNGDGFADVFVGAFGADPNGSSSGSSYVVFGRAPDSGRTRIGSAAGQYISGGPFADMLSGRGGRDGLEGRGGGDVLNGGPDSDTASYAHAPTGITASLAAPGTNTGPATGDSYTSIEDLTGSKFADTLSGNGLANILTGGVGKDSLRGLGGTDVFRYLHASDSKAGAERDQIADFNAGTAATSIDRIDLRAIDANTKQNGNQEFIFIGSAPFPLNTPGRLRVGVSGLSTIVSGDVNGDQRADFQIELQNFTNLVTLTAIDFMR